MDPRPLLPPILILILVAVAACGTILSEQAGLSATACLNVCWTLTSFCAAVACIRCARKVTERNLCYAWYLFGAGCASWFVGQMLWNYQELVRGQMLPFGGWQDAAFIGIGPFFLAGFYFYSGRNSTALVAARKLCNLAIVCCCTTAIVLLLCGKAIAARDSEAAFLFSVLGWGVLIPTASLFGLLCLWLYTPTSHFRPMILLVAGSGVMAVGGVEYAIKSATGTYQAGSVGDYLYLVAFGLFLWAARAQSNEPFEDSHRRSIRLGSLESAMPTICVVAVLATAYSKHADLAYLFPYALPVLGILAICVGVRDVWSAHIEKRLFERIRVSERSFRQIVDSNMIGILFTNFSGSISEANDAFLGIIGYSRDELQQGLLSWKRITPPEYAIREEAAAQEILSQGICTPYETEYIRKDGSRIPVLIGGALLPETKGCAVAFVVDLSARKRTEEELKQTQARLQAALDHLPFSFWSMDASGRYIYQNAVSIAMWGDQRGRRPEEVPQPSEMLRDRLDCYRRAFTGEVVRADITLGGEEGMRCYQRIVVPIKKGNEVTGIFGVNIDRTAERKVQLRLEESEARYRNLAEHSAVGIWHFDEYRRTVYANQHMLNLLGVKHLGDLDQRPLDEFLSKTSQHLWAQEYEKLRRGHPSTYEVELLQRNGETIPALVSCVPQLHVNGSLQGSIATFTNLTELKRAQHALEQSERRFRALVENASDGILAWDADGTIHYATPSNTRLMGYSQAELKGQSAFNFVAPEDVAGLKEALRLAVENRRSGIPIKARVRHKNGTWRQCEGLLTNLLNDPAVGALVVNYHDITERQESEDALRESEARLQAFMDNSPMIMFIKDLKGRYLHINKRWQEAHDFLPINTIGQTAPDIFPHEFAQAFTASDKCVLASGEPMQFEEVTLNRSERRSSIVHKFPLRDSAGQIKALGGIITDITERVRAEQALRLSEERYRSLVDGARDAIFTLSPEGVLTSANPAAEHLTGVPNIERLNRSFTEFVDAKDVTKAMDAFLRVLTGEKVQALELMILGAGERRVLVEFSATPQFDGDKIVGVLGIGRDITERRALEQQLRQSQKMESIGQLAGGVAHDFNNLLTVIQGNASLIEYERDIPAPVLSSVQEISVAADRAASLTRQLLAFSRRQLIQPRDLDINEIISDLAKMLRRLLGEDITLQVETSNLSLVHADAGMIEQVLLNLSVNARDAMPQGGQLTISTREVNVSEEEARKDTEARVGAFIRISVSDTGTGISPEHIPHIFEPFFTTKDVGKGTGLGLATVYGIVKQHNGWVSIQSTVGEGTRFDIYLPARPRRTESTPKNAPVGNAMPRGSETILVVEDEAPLRAMVKVVLSRLGYRVIEAASGKEALKLWPEIRETVDLVFTDMVMPGGLSGENLAEELQKDRPGLRILFTSGYSAQMLAHNGRLPAGAYCLQKPYLPPALANAVRTALQGDS